MRAWPPLAAAVVVGSVVLLSGCGGAGWTPEPSFEEQCGGTILEDSTTVGFTDGNGDYGSTTITIRLCVDRGGSVEGLDIR